MSLIAFILILISVVLHALWHFISKSQRPPLAFFTMVSTSSFICVLPFTLTSGLDLSALPLDFFIFAALGGLSGVVSDVGLSFAYRLADVSLAYPLCRALPVLLTAVVTFVTGYGTRIGWLGDIGLLVIFFGCLMMPLQDFRHMAPSVYLKNKALPWILVSAIGITAYTIFDKVGIDLMMRHGGCRNAFYGACAYSFCREGFLQIGLWSAILLMPHERVHLSLRFFSNKLAYLSGVFAAAAYVLVLLAMHWVTNVSYVQAFRQMSLPVSVFLGCVFLKEKATATKLIGLLLIVAGLIAIAFK